MKNLEQHLSDIFLLESLSDEQIKMVGSFCSIKKISKNELLFSENQKAAAFFSIISGKVKIYKLSEKGDEHTLEIHESGDMVAEAAIFDLETYPAYCQAMQETELIRIPKEEFIELLKHFPEISLKIMNSYSKRLRRFVKMVEELSLKDIRSRLANYLLENSETFPDRTICKIDISKKELASLLGTIPETISRTFKSFKADNIIDEKGNKIVILQPDKLKSFL